MSNGHIERTFSSLKLVKTNLRNKLSENHLDDLLQIAVDSPPLSQWDASGAIQLWWKDRQRFPEQARPFAKRTRSESHLDDASEYEETPPPAFTFNLDDWDSFIA